MLEKLKDYLQMPSTWKGIFMGLGLAGVILVPEQKEAVIATSVSLIGLIEIFTKEEKK